LPTSKPFIFKRYLRRAGGTLAVCIPPDAAENLDWKEGDELTLEIYPEDKTIIIKRKK